MNGGNGYSAPRAYLDNAATTYPKPLAVRQAMARAMTDLGANPGRGGFPMSQRTAQAVYSCREKLAKLFGAAGPECVVFQPNCTQALNQVMKGFLRAGDHVVVTDLEHNAVMRPLTALAPSGVTYTAARVTPGDNEATMAAFRKALQPNTRLLVCTQASNVFGIRVPVERLAALCHQYGAKICVDAAQSAGVVPINVMESGIDYLCCAGHKGLYGPMGTGVLVLRDPSDRLATLVEGGTGTQSKSLVQPDDPPERYESGTQNVPGIAGLSAGVDFVLSRGPERLYREEMEKLAYLYRGLASLPRVRLYTPPPQMPWFVPVLAFNVEGLPSEQVGAALARRNIAVRCGLHCAPAAHQKMGTGQDGVVRASVSAFTRREELDALLRVVRAL